MRLPLTLLLIGLPLAEIATFIQVGQWLGLGPTLALVLLAGAGRHPGHPPSVAGDARRGARGAGPQPGAGGRTGSTRPACWSPGCC